MTPRDKPLRGTERPEKRPEKRADRWVERKPEVEERARHPRIDTPRELRRSLVRRPSVDQDTFGIFAERFARFMGTARFLIYMTLFVAVWLGWNVLAPKDLRFDPYAFIFLTLMLSLQASYAAPLILLAQNRQEDRDRVVGEQDRQANARAHADMEFLAREVASLRMAMGEVATRDYLRSELRALLTDLEERDQAAENGADVDREGHHAEGGHSDGPDDDREAPGAGPVDARRDERHAPRDSDADG
ncbi:MAG TPA: DUF1003 domain-containing protein [Marmoricola sp.]|nr:DUF1003 domain-containing protein [Marmoricola sp.]